MFAWVVANAGFDADDDCRTKDFSGEVDFVGDWNGFESWAVGVVFVTY